ncbi:glycosyltransferase [Cellulomonas xiejunii]|uniref:Glycosyltransferase n=1 Tax=Cellulomonas xiejunii TaxID=2968083 RepID=A0ABY5KQU3_9CELL|nr:glycosyltransferase [Cellulomonas xiejunii]MCC2321244.1 glycosyltransferase [Cellulomonas xiejunii]UUI71831.1 glycosyltransferase [Cellulomonas xiejunii]
MASQRGISVVVPVKGRVPLMRAQLASLRTAMEHSPEPAEVVVVDDSEPDDAEAHRVSCRELGARYVPGPRHVGAKRNLGVDQARYDLILFTDSDCRVSPDVLKRHVTTLRDADSTVGGVSGPTFVDHGRTRGGRIMRWSRLINDDLERPGRAAKVTWATTTNLVVRREVFEEVGGFPSESLDIVGGEDCDLGIKITDAGYTIVCDPDAVVLHDHAITESLATAARRLHGYGRSEQWVCSVHPHHRRPVLNAFTVASTAALAGIALAPRSRGAGLLAGPAVLALVVAARARGLRDEERAVGGGGTAERLACAAVDLLFDLGGFQAALQMGRPSGLVTGLRPADDVRPEGGGGRPPGRSWLPVEGTGWSPAGG